MSSRFTRISIGRPWGSSATVRRRPKVGARRGVTLVELMISLAVTAMIGAAIAAMMAAVSSGVGVRRDTRGIVLRGHTAHIRLASYITSARCVLGQTSDTLTLWMNDTRESWTVHASEIRWFEFDVDAGELRMHFVTFPPEWTDHQKAIADTEYPSNTSWSAALDLLTAADLIATVVIVDGVSALSIELDQPDPQQARQVTVDLIFDDAPDGASFRSKQSIRFHHRPVQ